MPFIYLLVYPRAVLGPLLFTLYTAPLSHVIAEHDVEHNFYADDTQISISLSGSEALESLPDLKSCVTDVFTWMTNSNRYFCMYVTYVVYRCYYGVRYCTCIS